MTGKLTKIERRWVIIIEREDGTVNDYRFPNKMEAKKWAALAGVEI